MPRKTVVSHTEILESLLSTDDYFSSEGAIHPPAHPVWKEVASRLENRLTPKYVWVMVRQNRHSFQDKIRTHFNLNKEESGKSSQSFFPSSNESNSLSSSESNFSISLVSNTQCNQPQIDFIVIISPEVWRELNPSERNWKTSGQPHRRTHLQFERGWTSKIIDLLWTQHRIPCPYTFKKLFIAKNTDSARHFLKIKAFCKECQASAVGTMIERPLEGESSQMLWRAVDTRGVSHSKKRPIVGELRKKVGNQVHHIAASMYRRTEAVKKMNFGDPEPPNLPTNNTLRKIKQEQRSQQMQLPKEDDPILALIGMKYRHPYAGIIHEIAADKFMVSYHSPVQQRFYREFRRTNYTVMSFDATGSLVQKIRRPSGRSGHIFLYEAVINTGKAQFPIFQFLSEKHDANSICYCLNEWERSGQLSPHETVCDQSKALLSALARSFGKSGSFKQYKETCFLALMDNTISLPPCFIRIDICHFISSASKWSLWKQNSHKRIQEFYLRCLGLLTKCVSLDKFEAILFNVFCCSLAETDGIIVGSDVPTPSESSRKQLLDWIEAFQVDIENSTLKIFSGDSDSTNAVAENEEEETTTDKDGVIELWITKIFLKAIDFIEQAAGDRLSPYFAPLIGQKFRAVAHDFVVWSNVMIKQFKAPNTTANSSSVEGDFNDLKHRILQGDYGPMAAHKFVAKHINAIEGAVLLASASLKEPSIDKTEDEELNYFENWKGQAVPAKSRRVPKYVVPCPQIKAVEEVQKLKPPSASLQLLINGNLTGFITVEGVVSEVKNTCSFDSICQIIAMMYSESENFRLLMVDSENLSMQTSKSLALYGATTSTYILRCKALATVLKGKRLKHSTVGGKSDTNFVRYECYGNLSGLLRQIFQDMPSMTVTNSCFNTFCTKKLKMNIKKFITLEVNANILLAEGFSSIERAVADWIKNSEKSCCENVNINRAMGPVILIDTDFLGITGVDAIYGATNMYNRSCAIKDIPPYVKINEENLTLRGLVAYLPAHYVGYARHHSGQWDAYDDMANRVMTAIKDDYKILPHLLVYSKY